ncbi:hypothetical protein LXL04_011193 [Taraxacum kok-saghyz]
MNFALQSHHFKAKKFEKKLKFYAKVRYKAALGAQKTIKKKKNLRSRQKKLKAYNLFSLLHVLPDVEPLKEPTRILSLKSHNWSQIASAESENELQQQQTAIVTYTKTAYKPCELLDLPKIAKVGEGTYGEVFIGGETVCKVAPFNGDSLVNGEIQKWFVVFLQEDVGKDLESLVLLSFKEAQSLLLQVTTGLAVAEAEFEFDHRDLHWYNCKTLEFIIDGKKMHVKTHGVVASITDFTFSRINTGEDVSFLDLSLDPVLFEGPKGKEMNRISVRVNYLDRTSKETMMLRSFKKRLNDYGSAKESIDDPFISDLIVSEF